MARTLENTIKVYDDGSVEVIPAWTPPPPPPPTSNLILGGYFDGIPDVQARVYADEFNMGWVRVWFGVHDWTQPPTATHSVFQRCRQLRAQGLKVLLVVTPIEARLNGGVSVPSAPSETSTVNVWFDRAAQAAGGCVDAWEVMNEPNLSNYNADYNKLGNTVKFVLQPAYLALKGRDQFVVGASWSGETDSDAWRYFISKGYLGTCDAAAIHPYGTSADQQIARVAYARDYIADHKPLWVTEWNLHDQKEATYGQELMKAAAGIKPLVNAVFHFKFTVNTSPAGKFAPLNADLTRREPWYTVTREAMRSF